MNILNIVLDKTYKLQASSSVSNNRLIKKVILSISKHPKKDIGELVYLKSKYAWKRSEFGGLYFISIVDISEVEHYKKLAWIDDLTGVYNRHAIDKTLHSIASNIIRNKRNLGIIFVDVDNLKSINTHFGYIGGDKAITQVAKISDDTVRKYDVVFRYGGDEFLVLCDLIDDGFKSISRVASRIVRNVEQKTRPRNTVSVGGVVLNTAQTKQLLNAKPFNREWTKIIKACDKLVRKSKTSGKNQFNVERYEE